MTQVIVVGAGPAGRAVTHRLLVHGVTTTIVDPAPDKVWRSHFAAWTDEIPAWVDPSALAASVSDVAVRVRQSLVVPRGYSVFDTAVLHRNLDITGARVITGRAHTVSATQVVLAGGDRHHRPGTTLRADTVIDCRGGRGSRCPRQTAYGVVVGSAAAAAVTSGAPAMLMDWRKPAAHDEAEWVSRPSFLYVIPLGPDRVLLEETCLAGQPALSFADLARRLQMRLAAAGVGATTAYDIERVSFPLAGAGRRPWARPTVTFGARGGFLNPTTGYSVAEVLRTADRLARGIRAGDDLTDALWPRPARAVWELRLRSLSALLSLDADQTQNFFSAFFALPMPMQRALLSERTDLRGTLAAMARVFCALDQPTRRRVATAVGRSPRRLELIE